MYETLLVEVDGAVATVTMNRPERRNAINTAMLVELHSVLEDLAERDDLRVVVLTGAGDRFFCPGADLDASRRAADAPAPEMRDPRLFHIPVLLHEMPHVTVAAINGACAGAGLGWAAACDLRVASANAMFATAFLDIGLAGDMGLPWSLSRILGAGRARELSFLRGKFDAAAALEMGLVSAVHPVDDLRAAVAAICDRLRSAAPSAMRALKANYVATERLPFADFVELETQRHLQLATEPEFRARVAAFLAARSSGGTGAGQ